MSTVIAGMEKIANAAGYNLIIGQSQENFTKEVSGVNTLFNSRVDGLLISLAADTRNIDHFNVFLKKQIPLIFFDRVIEHPACTCIVIDNVKAGYNATMHLIEQGCRRIAHVGGNMNRNVYADRLKGQVMALKEKGIEHHSSLVISNNLSDQEGAEAALQLLKYENRPDGIFAANDTSGVAIIRELKQTGISVPNDIAIVGFNNDPISKVIEPNLTTINYPGPEMGEVAAQTLIDKLRENPPAHLNSIVLQHELIVRASSLRK
jgi:LacI family transcriptional regulator